MNSIKTLCFVLLVFLASCAKDETADLYDNTTTLDAPLQLVKIASWNSVSGMETINTEFMYEPTGRISKFFHNKIALIPTYNSIGKVGSATGVNEKGGVVSYNFEYNTAGQVIKLVYVFMNPTDFGYTRTFSYNTAGKISRISTLSAIAGSTPTVVEYTWKGDNIETSVSVNSSSTYTSRYISYDEKLNPYGLNNGLAAILGGFPVSKNNFTEITATTTSSSAMSAAYSQKRTYTYHSSGYALNISLSDGGNELTRFYYNK